MKAPFAAMLRKARKEGYAVAAVNVLNHLTFSAVVEAAVRTKSPVIIQTSVATVKALKPAALAAWGRTIIDAAPVPVAMHLDHCQSFEICQTCCDLGWDAVMFDGSSLSYEDNIKQTKAVREYARKKNVDVEGEVGIIAGVEDDISHDTASLAGFEDTMRYITETGVEAIAPAIGTAHGVYTGTPKINFDLVQKLGKATDCPIVVHGGTGLDDDVFRKLIELGASKINISTALKLAYTGSMKQYLNENEKVNPLKLDDFVFGKVVELAEGLFNLFGSAGKQ